MPRHKLSHLQEQRSSCTASSQCGTIRATAAARCAVHKVCCVLSEGGMYGATTQSLCHGSRAGTAARYKHPLVALGCHDSAPCQESVSSGVDLTGAVGWNGVRAMQWCWTAARPADTASTHDWGPPRCRGCHRHSAASRARGPAPASHVDSSSSVAQAARSA